MSQVFFDELGIAAARREPGGRLGQPRRADGARSCCASSRCCRRSRPDWLVVVGDVNSTMACALVAAKLGVRVGARRGGAALVRPRRCRRRSTGSSPTRIADLLLTPSPDADENLRREGVPGRAHPLRRQRDDRHARARTSSGAGARRRRGSLGVEPRRYGYVTLHRPSNVDDRESLAAIVACLRRRLATRCRWCSRSTRARASGSRTSGCSSGSPARAGVKLVEPVGYLDSIGLAEAAPRAC